jgi:hypothetical protein
MAINRRTGLLALLLAVSAAGAWEYLGSRHTQAARITAPKPATVVKDGVPADDIAAVPESIPPPASAWLNARTRRYAGLFRNWQCDTLVVPVQVENAGFDRPNRQIMSADLALALSAAGGCVTDPFLVDIALGDSLRRRDAAAVLELARTIKAHRIVTSYAGHDESGRMRVTLQVTQLDPSKPEAEPLTVAAHSFDDLHYEATQPPFAAFAARLPQMLAAVGLPTPPPPRVVPGKLPEVLPHSLERFKQSGDGSPVEQAAQLMFLAMLTPDWWRAGNRLFSKAWVALENADPADPTVRLLRARIMLHLQERPFALAQLEGANGAAADGLRALLNGNLPQARQALAQDNNPWDRFFLGLEVHDLELLYQREPRRSAAEVQQWIGDTPWQVFARLRLEDNDMWGVSSTVWLKWLLDREFPILGFSLSDSGIGRTMLAVFDRPDAELSALRHIYRLEQEQPQLWCCSSFSTAPKASDLLDLLDSRVEMTLGRQAYFLYSPQGNYDGALQLLQKYDDLLAGSPCAEELRAEIYWAQLGKQELGKHDELSRLMRQSALATAWWEQGQTNDSNNALWYMSQPPQEQAIVYLVKYYDDYPVRSYWNWHGHVPNTEERLDFSTLNIQPLADLLKNSSGDKHAAYLAMLDTRFLGGADSTQLRLDNMPAEKRTSEYLRGQIAGDPDNYRYYSTLARLLINQNAFDETSRVMQSYPLFHEEKPDDSVTLAHHAASWGRALFWLGATDQARPLLRIAADYQNGSAASVDSAAQLALLDHDYAGAADGFLEAAEHYDSMWDYQEYLDLSFASGQDRDAWSLFDRLTGRYEAPALWESAMVGHRKAGTSRAAIREWVRQRLAGVPAGASHNDLLSYALVEEFVDRTPAPDFADYIGSLVEKPELPRTPAGQLAALTGPDKPDVIGSSEFGRQRRTPLTVMEPIPNRFVLFAEGLSAERLGHYAEAVHAFDQLSAFYKIESGSFSIAAPYFAFAAAKTGDTLGLQKFLDDLPEQSVNYDILLARAVFSALAGKHELAQTQLDKAFHNWPVTATLRELHSAYGYLDICTMLFEATGDARYRQDALRLARTLRQAEPTRAYGQALVAYLGDQENERVEALAAALYLDPQSRWASMAPAALREKAQNWSKLHPLFAAGGSN